MILKAHPLSNYKIMSVIVPDDQLIDDRFSISFSDIHAHAELCRLLQILSVDG